MDPYFRIGGGTRGAEDLKSHQFFSGINWTDMYEKKVNIITIVRILVTSLKFGHILGGRGWHSGPNVLLSQVKPPFVPNVDGNDDDTSNFDPMFTDETPNFTPVNEGKQQHLI